MVQFLKYAAAGVAATGVDMLCFYFLAWKIFPALPTDDVVVKCLHLSVETFEASAQARNFVLCSGVAFLFSNLTAYLINIAIVFEPGRHSRWVEIGLFYLVSVSSLAFGTFLGWAMIEWLSLSTSASYLGKLISALLINYACRKYIIFKS